MPHRPSLKGSSSKNILLHLAMLVGVFLLILVGWRYTMTSSLFWGRERYSVVVASSPPIIITYNSKSGEASLIILPQDTYLRVPGGFGYYRVGQLWNLGKQEKRGGMLLKTAVQSFFGAPIDGWIGWDKTPELSVDKERPQEVYKQLSQWISPQPLTFFRASYLSSLSLGDRFLLWNNIRNLQREKMIVHNLSSKGILIDKQLADGSHAYVGEPDLVDKVSQTIFFEKDAQDEPEVYRILNATNTNGVGNTIARTLTNVGYHVSTVSNAPGPQSACQVQIPHLVPLRKQIERAANIIGCPITIAPDLPARDDKEIVVTVGEEVAQTW